MTDSQKDQRIAELEETLSLNEGRRLFRLCVQHGALPGNVYQWLKERLSRQSCPIEEGE